MSEAIEKLEPADAGIIQGVLDGRWAGIRDSARDLAKDPRFAVEYGEDTETQRARVLERLQALAEAGHSRHGFPTRYGGANDVGGAITSFEMLAMGDLSLLVKSGVQWGLFGGAILHLGTERHHDRFLADVITLDALGCFAMTETGHGSDVASIRTTATYDASNGEFELHTPDDSARKEYIGNAARDGRWAAVFAQLRTNDSDEGGARVPRAHPRRRGQPDARRAHRGLRVQGRSERRRQRAAVLRSRPGAARDDLLNRYGDVAADGSYSTPFDNQTKRFFTMLGTLVQGRISVAGGAGSATKVALGIAVRYGDQRRQFAGPDGTEIVVNDYLAHQRRLLPALAKTYALHFAQLDLVQGLHETTP